jgi:hypothetical protein
LGFEIEGDVSGMKIEKRWYSLRTLRILFAFLAVKGFSDSSWKKPLTAKFAKKCREGRKENAIQIRWGQNEKRFGNSHQL